MDRQVSDQELIARALQGESVAFDALWRRHERAVGRVCREFLEGPHRDPAIEAQDLANETFVRALHFLYRYEDRSAAGAAFEDWLLEVTRRVCLKSLARQRRRDRLLSGRLPELAAGSGGANHGGDPLRAVVECDALRAAVQAVNALPQNYRTPFKLSLEEHSHHEIASALGISVEAAAKRVQRARGLLRPRLQAAFGDEPAPAPERRVRQPRGLLSAIEHALTDIVGDHRIVDVLLPSAGRAQLCVRIKPAAPAAGESGRRGGAGQDGRGLLADADRCYYRGAWAEAREEYRLALAAAPRCFEAALRLGEMLRLEERPLAAADVYRAALQENPPHAVAVRIQAHLLAAEDRLEAAAEAFRYALQLAPGDPGCHFGLHRVLGSLSRFEAQLRNLADLRARRPDNVEAYVEAYTPCARLERWDIALPLLQEAVQIDPNYPPAIKHLFQVRMNLGLCDVEAGDLAERLVRLAPDFIDSWSQLAWFHAEQGRDEESIAVLQAFLREHPDNAGAHAALAWRWHYQRKYVESRRHACMAFALEPQNWHNCWTMLATHGGSETGISRSEAAAMAAQIASRFPADAFVMECLGGFFAGRGEAGEALRFTAKSRSLNPGSPTANRALAQILHRFGRYHEAVEAWRCLLELQDGRTAAHLAGLARSLAALDSPEQEAVFAEATRAARSARDWANVAEHMEQAGRIEAAAEAYCRCLEMNPPTRSLRSAAMDGLGRTMPPAVAEPHLPIFLSSNSPTRY